MQPSLPQCPICLQSYNLTSRKPFYICPNSHSLCGQCCKGYPIHARNACPLCKTKMNQNLIENRDAISLLGTHAALMRLKQQSWSQNYPKMMDKLNIWVWIRVASLFALFCLVSVLFGLLVELAHLFLSLEKWLSIGIAQSIVWILSILGDTFLDILEKFTFLIPAIIAYTTAGIIILWQYSCLFYEFVKQYYFDQIFYGLLFVCHFTLFFLFLVAFSASKVISILQQKWGINTNNDLSKVELPKNNFQRWVLFNLFNFCQFIEIHLN